MAVYHLQQNHSVGPIPHTDLRESTPLPVYSIAGRHERNQGHESDIIPPRSQHAEVSASVRPVSLTNHWFPTHQSRQPDDVIEMDGRVQNHTATRRDQT